MSLLLFLLVLLVLLEALALSGGAFHLWGELGILLLLVVDVFEELER